MERDTAISSHQIRAARGLLDWSQDDLAAAANLSVATIRKLELGYISPRHSTTHIILCTFEAAGLEFLESEGIRRRSRDVEIHSGLHGMDNFFDDVSSTLRKSGGEMVLVSNTSVPHQALKPILDGCATVTIKCLLTEYTNHPFISPRLDIRALSRRYVDPMPFYVYANKYAMPIFGIGSSAKIIVTHSMTMAEASRRQFFSMWDVATPIMSNVAMIADVKLKAFKEGRSS